MTDYPVTSRLRCESGRDAVPFTVHFHGLEADTYATVVAGLGIESSLPLLERVRCGRYPDQPFILDDMGRPLAAVNEYFASRLFRSFRPLTQPRYAHSIGVWLKFCASRGTTWDSASPGDVSDFKYWRMTDPGNPNRVTGSSMHVDLAAMSSFYSWAESRLDVVSPVLRREVTRSAWSEPGRWRSAEGAPKAEPAGVRDRDVKWLDPRAVERWIDLGLRGFDAAGRERDPSRNRTGSRDAAYAGLLYGSGLRATEGGSLLLNELPAEGDDRVYYSRRLASKCAKRRQGRTWWLPRSSLDEVQLYIDGGRGQAVRRAQQAGRYEKLLHHSIIERELAPRRLLVRRDGVEQVVPLDELDPRERLSLYRRTPTGIEPAALWLNENGMPRPTRAWNDTFATGNERLERLGMPWFRCVPHMLRHSFALRWYSVGRLLWDRRLAHLSEREQQDFRSQFGDTWSFVQTLLGHRHPQTTANIYLEPFRGLEVQLLLECIAELPLSGFMEAVFQSDPRVLHDPLGPEL